MALSVFKSGVPGPSKESTRGYASQHGNSNKEVCISLPHLKSLPSFDLITIAGQAEILFQSVFHDEIPVPQNFHHIRTARTFHPSALSTPAFANGHEPAVPDRIAIARLGRCSCNFLSSILFAFPSTCFRSLNIPS